MIFSIRVTAKSDEGGIGQAGPPKPDMFAIVPYSDYGVLFRLQQVFIH